jgi:hypothetical protein
METFMRLIHYSDTRLASVYSVEQAGEAYQWHGGRKPVGLWVSVEGQDDWRSWCEAEDFRDCGTQCQTEVILQSNHNILIIGCLAGMLQFHREYAIEKPNAYRDEQVIDWPRVARAHQGIIIAPYRWEQRLNDPCQGWYYSWDCASGCIWDASAVAGLLQIQAALAA